MVARIRRSPLLMGLIAVVVIAGLAFAWWTISPLFIRTTVTEGQDIVLPASPPAPPASASEMDKVTPTPESAMMDKSKSEMMSQTPGAASSAATQDAMSQASDEEAMKGAEVLAAGNFDRKDDVHYANGQAILARLQDGSTVLRLQDLESANGPDLYVYVSEHPNPQTRDEFHTGEHNLGRLKATNGSFNYTLDPSIDPSKIKSVVIYCRAFSVLFSTAALSAQ